MKNIVKEAAEKAHAKRTAWAVKQFDGGKTMEQIGNVLGISRQRVGQMLRAAGVTKARAAK